MKTLIILNHSWSPFITILLIWKKWSFAGLCVVFWSIFTIKNCLQIIHANHMTVATSGQIYSWPDYLKTKGNVNIKLLDLRKSLIVYILLCRCQWVHMALAVKQTWSYLTTYSLWSAMHELSLLLNCQVYRWKGTSSFLQL